MARNRVLVLAAMHRANAALRAEWMDLRGGWMALRAEWMDLRAEWMDVRLEQIEMLTAGPGRAVARGRFRPAGARLRPGR